MRLRSHTLLFLAPLLTAGCQPTRAAAAPLLLAPELASWVLSSPDFEAGAALPAEASCDGDGISPALRWTNPPEGARSLTLVLSDPGSRRGRWVSWLLMDIPPETQTIARGSSLGTEGINDENWLGYGPPCPRRDGETHALFFELYAMDTVTDMPRSTSLDQLRPMLRAHALGVSVLSTTTKRGG